MTGEPTENDIGSCFERRLRTDIRLHDRLTGLLTRSVPSQFPARLCLSVAEAGPRAVPRERLEDAVVAIEYACLHQYVHAIPRSSTLVEPAVDSAYVDTESLAILDGDVLQACAFTRLGNLSVAPERVEQLYGRLAKRSLDCYAMAIDQEWLPPGSTQRNLAGFGAALGAVMGGVDASESLPVTGQALGGTVPVLTPSGWMPPTEETAEQAIATFLGSVEVDTDELPTLWSDIEGIVRAERALSPAEESG